MSAVRERLLARVEYSHGDCWVWTGSVNNRGYGQMQVMGKRKLTHRLAYEEFVGAIPDGATIDHLCRYRRCFNPDHLDAVSMRENLRRGMGWAGRNARKTHCPREHAYTEDNTYTDARGGRVCRACGRERARRVYGWAGGVPSGDRTHCPKGHPYDEDNAYVWGGRRYCKACRRIRKQASARRLVLENLR